MSDDPSTTKRRPRISLLNLLLLTGLIASWITVAVLWRDMGPLRAEVAALRAELGELTITDPTQFHAIRVETNDRRLWKWRIWVPEGTNYLVNAAGGLIGGQGIPYRGGSGPLSPGEYVVQHEIRPDAGSGEMRGYYSFRCFEQVKAGTAISGETGAHAWVNGGYHVSMPDGVGYETTRFEPGKTVLLCRHRVGKSSIGSAAEDLKPGFMIWLTPAE